MSLRALRSIVGAVVADELRRTQPSLALRAGLPHRCGPAQARHPSTCRDLARAGGPGDRGRNVLVHEGIVMSTPQTRRLSCCCCGEDAGLWQQWFNRDTGYGMCVKCIEWLRRENRASEKEIRDLYGIEGINWGQA